MKKLSLDQYFMGVADAVSKRASCIRRQVGAVIVLEGRIISTGYNGTPRGIKNCDEGGCERCNSPSATSGIGLSECLCSHAEENAIAQAAYHGVAVKGSLIYTTLFPCKTCAKLLINSGIKEVIYSEIYPTLKEVTELLQLARVVIRTAK